MWVLLVRVLFGSGAGLIVVGLLEPQRGTNEQKGSETGLIARPPLVTVEGRESTKEKAGFELFNPSSSPITISKVVSDCPCLGFDLPEMVVIAPGQSSRLSFDVDVPRFGTKRSRLQIRHDGPHASTVVFVDAMGSGRLPIVAGTDNASPTFFDLQDTTVTQEVVIRTWEELGSPPWMTGVACTSPLLTLEFRIVGEVNVLALGRTERKYVCKIGWNRLPTSPEIAADLAALTKSDDGPIKLGAVRAALKRTHTAK